VKDFKTNFIPLSAQKRTLLMIENVIKNLKSILGNDNVLTAYEDRYCYAYDATALGDKLYLPDIVVLPSSKDQVSEI
jgi:glycolate oxidase